MPHAAQRLNEKRTARAKAAASKPRKKKYLTKRDILSLQFKAAQSHA